jgi:hypothetical protein
VSQKVRAAPDTTVAIELAASWNPFRKLPKVRGFVEELGGDVAGDMIRLVLEMIDLDPIFPDPREVAEAGDCRHDRSARLLDDRRAAPSPGSRWRYLAGLGLELVEEPGLLVKEA